LKRFQGKNIVITGASKGIGTEIARQLSLQGARLILVSRDMRALTRVREDLITENKNAQIELIPCDLGDLRQIEVAAKKIISIMPSIDGLVNNAGYARPGYFHELPIDEFEKAITVDYLGAVRLTRLLIDAIATHGFISVTSSVVGYMGVFGYSSYAGAKFALIGFAETLRQELAERKIQISVLCPPDTQTPGYEEENKTKPKETLALSANAKLMTAADVAKKFIRGVSKGKFIITCNFESAMLYRLHGIMPSLVFRIMMSMINKAKKT